MPNSESYHLERFVEAQEGSYAGALGELRRGEEGIALDLVCVSAGGGFGAEFSGGEVCDSESGGSGGVFGASGSWGEVGGVCGGFAWGRGEIGGGDHGVSGSFEVVFFDDTVCCGVAGGECVWAGAGAVLWGESG